MEFLEPVECDPQARPARRDPGDCTDAARAVPLELEKLEDTMAIIEKARSRLLPRGLNTERVALFLLVCLAGRAFAVAIQDRSSPPDGSRMVLVPGGSFAMGDVYAEGDDNEQPVHQVTVAPFYLADAEVSVGQFRRFVRATGYRTSAEGPMNRAAQDSLIRIGMNPELPREARVAAYDAALGFSGCAWWDPDRRGFDFDEHLNWRVRRFEQTDAHPAVCLSWEDAASYANWVSELDGLPPAYDIESGTLLDGEGNATTDITEVTGASIISVFPNIRRAFDTQTQVKLDPQRIEMSIADGILEVLKHSEIFKQAYYVADQGWVPHEDSRSRRAKARANRLANGPRSL